MRFVCSREELVQAISTVERAVPTRDVDDSLKGILLEAHADHLQLTAFDLQLGIECTAAAEVARQGAVMVDARLFSQLTRKLPGQQVEFVLEPGAGAATVRSGRAEFTIHTRDASSFPKLPEPVGDVAWTIQQSLLREMIRQTVFAAAVDDHRSYLNGVLFEVMGDQLNLVATDTNRLAYRTGKLVAPAPMHRALVPARAAQELARIIPADAEGLAQVLVTERQISFRLDGVRLVSRLLEGQFPNYRQVLPQKQPVNIVVNRDALAAAVERASVLARTGPAVVIIEVKNQTLTLRARETDVGQSQEQIDIVQEGEDGVNSYQARFILDVLRAYDGEALRISFAEGDVPASFRPVDNDDYLCLIMPVRLS